MQCLQRKPSTSICVCISIDMCTCIFYRPGAGLESYIGSMQRLQKAVQFFNKNNPDSPEMSQVVSIFCMLGHIFLFVGLRYTDQNFKVGRSGKKNKIELEPKPSKSTSRSINSANEKHDNLQIYLSPRDQTMSNYFSHNCFKRHVIYVENINNNYFRNLCLHLGIFEFFWGGGVFQSKVRRVT